jgi:hypothetical protein
LSVFASDIFDILIVILCVFILREMGLVAVEFVGNFVCYADNKGGFWEVEFDCWGKGYGNANEASHNNVGQREAN